MQPRSRLVFPKWVTVWAKTPVAQVRGSAESADVKAKAIERRLSATAESGRVTPLSEAMPSLRESLKNCRTPDSFCMESVVSVACASWAIALRRGKLSDKSASNSVNPVLLTVQDLSVRAAERLSERGIDHQDPLDPSCVPGVLVAGLARDPFQCIDRIG